MPFKFDAPTPVSRGVAILLRAEDGVVVGGITSCFVSSRQGAFSTNTRPGYLTATARITDPASGETTIVAEWSNSTCLRRADADKAFRAWIRANSIRDRMIEAAERRIPSEPARPR